ncbi:hypothetical protein PanWU01x14_348120 [Parasponia andersonii]|uniref:Transmembrane protein n=1 Tax=Parasponia andersonii TaxID=3476 RepID=A0A2P5ABS5_PARAD|nr:hypothetical protein PanWU01x14_348120 [Parasponia andersonii]
MASRASTLMMLFCLILASFALVYTTTAAHVKGFKYFKTNSKDDPKHPPQGAKRFANFQQNSNDEPRQPPEGAKGFPNFGRHSDDDPKQPPQGAKGYAYFRQNSNGDPRQPPRGAKGIRPKANVSPASPVLSSLAKALQSKSNGSPN